MLLIICRTILGSLCWLCIYALCQKYEAWWQKYDYLLATGIDAGIAFSSIIIFFAVMYHEKIFPGGVTMFHLKDGTLQ